MTTIQFKSEFIIVGDMGNQFTMDEIKNEPMFFNADNFYSMEHGGPVTHAFFRALPDDWKPYSQIFIPTCVFDSRVHMLMDNWYPAIPGWHHDDVPRTRDDGQPNYINPHYLSEHILATVGTVAPTLFAIGEVEFDIPEPGGENVYKAMNDMVEVWVEAGDLEIVESEPGKLYSLNHLTLHTGQSASEFGWRWFGRASRNTERMDKMTNEIRRQVQVYLSAPMDGW